MRTEAVATPIVLDLGQPPSLVRLALAIKAPVHTVRHLIRVGELIAAGAGCDNRTAMLAVADAYGRAAQAGQYSELIRTEMLTAELRARRLADHLT